MKHVAPFAWLICLSVLLPLKLLGYTCGQSAPDTVTTTTVITGSCIINGDLVILNNGALHVDLTGGSADTFVVRGNITLYGNATLLIDADSGSTGAQFIVSNQSNNQRTITTYDSSRVLLQYVEFRTQEGDLSNASSYYMNYTAYNNSALSVTGCTLSTTTAWLLCNVRNTSTLIISQSKSVPTESYLQDSAQISVTGANTSTGLWLLFESTTDTLNLPDQTGANFNWQVGRGQGGVHSAPWFLNVADAKPGLGVQIQPTGRLVVNGHGTPSTGEIHANLLFANGTDTVQGLGAGLQNLTIANGRLTLNNTNLGPVGWQLYSVSNETLHIVKSTVNEIGMVGPANTVTVDSSILQLATLSALGSSISSLYISNSSIWSQAIIAQNTSTIMLSDCNVTGSWFSTDPQSAITVTRGCFFQNPTGCTPDNMVNINTGMPNCNPFITAGAPKILTPSTITLSGVSSNCTTGVEDVTGAPLLNIYPNPFSAETRIAFDPNAQYRALTLYNALGQPVRQLGHIGGSYIILQRNGLAAGIYYVRITGTNNSSVTGKLVVVD